MKLSIVSTLYYSQDYVDEFCNRVAQAASSISTDFEIILVNDGSPDGSLEKALTLQKKYSTITIVDLSRNFGHHRAIMTGLHYAKGDFVFLIDSDLEEAPELLLDYWKEIQQPGIDVVLGIQKARKGGWFERISGKLFYWFFSILTSVEYPANSLTARLMTKRYVDSVIKFKEKELDIWGVFVLAGYNQKSIQVIKTSKGLTTYTFRRKVKMAIEVITTVSHRPLYLTFLFGVLFMVLSLISVIVIIYEKYFHYTTEGWASIVALILFVNGVVFFILGIFGIYLSKMFLEIKNRPLTLIRDVFPSQNHHD
ncbi:MAG: glycosyltransferase [Cyclobacteriaceae bacterium]|nr:glycosyltransferase [Cyclobacteriaceae bacterium]